MKKAKSKIICDRIRKTEHNKNRGGIRNEKEQSKKPEPEPEQQQSEQSEQPEQKRKEQPEQSLQQWKQQQLRKTTSVGQKEQGKASLFLLIALLMQGFHLKQLIFGEVKS